MKPLKIAHSLASVQHFCSFQSLPNGSFAFFSPVRCKVVAKKGRQSFLIAWSLQNKCTIYLGTHGTNNLDELFYLYWISQILPIFNFLLLLSGLIFNFLLCLLFAAHSEHHHRHPVVRRQDHRLRRSGERPFRQVPKVRRGFHFILLNSLDF